jgi:hypothetical protein
LQRFTINLGSRGGKTFFCKIQDGGLLKLKNIQRLSTKALAID